MAVNHHTMIRLADYPLLEQLAKTRTKATRLDARACQYVYERSLREIDLANIQIQPEELELIESLGLAALLQR